MTPGIPPSASDVRVERDERVLTLTFDRPGDQNRLTRDVLLTMQGIADDLRDDDEIQAVVVTGSGAEFFSMGILNPTVRASYTKEQILDLVRIANRLYDAIEALPQIVIAAFNGAARAGAAELALACDIRLAAAHATFRLPEALWGGFPGAGGPVRLPAIVGRGRALELICTGREIDAGEMECLGLVLAVYPADRVRAEAQALAARIAASGPLATRGAKRIMNAGRAAGFAAARSLSDALRHALEWSHDVDEMAAERPHAQAIASRHEQLSYAALRARVDELARALVAVEVTRGDRVAVLLPNCPEWVVAALAIAKIGGIVSAISTFSTARELGWMLEHSEAVALITVSAFRGRAYLDALHDLCPELAASAPGALRSARLPRLRTVVSMDGRRGNGVFQPEDFLRRGAGLGTAALRVRQRSVSPSDVCYILYTSGSTATPKGVTLAHGGVIENGFNIGERQHLTPADRLWLAVPLFWSFGSANALPAILTHGGCAVLQESFEPGEALELLERERCSVYYGMANMARAMLEHPDRGRRRLDSMRTGLTIGLAEDIEMTMEAVGARELCNVYGSTETYGNCAVTDAHDPLELRLHTQGLPLPGMDIRVADPETRRPLPAGEVGELCVAGHVTPGYFRAPDLDA